MLSGGAPQRLAAHRVLTVRAVPLIGPSSTSGATTPSWRSPATKVVVFQWPCGTALTSRSPRGRPPPGPRHRRRRPGFVDEDQPLRREPTLRLAEALPLRRHVRARLLGRVRRFFDADPMAAEEPPDRHPARRRPDRAQGRADLVQRQVRLRLQQRQDARPIRLGRPRTPVPAHRRRRHAAGPPGPGPAGRIARSDTDRRTRNHLAKR